VELPFGTLQVAGAKAQIFFCVDKGKATAEAISSRVSRKQLKLMQRPATS